MSLTGTENISRTLTIMKLQTGIFVYSAIHRQQQCIDSDKLPLVAELSTIELQLHETAMPHDIENLTTSFLFGSETSRPILYDLWIRCSCLEFVAFTLVPWINAE